MVENETLYEKTKRIERLIREEYSRLDGLSHLNGSELPIAFEYTLQVYGDFNTHDKRFCFAVQSFADGENALDNIRHQYAHYMSCQLYGAVRPHGPEWKKCCVIVEAVPLPWLYRREEEAASPVTKVFSGRENRAVTAMIPSNSRKMVGCAIVHPKFGYGLITNVTCKGARRFARIYFGESGGIKEIDLEWIENHGGIHRSV